MHLTGLDNVAMRLRVTVPVKFNPMLMLSIQNYIDTIYYFVTGENT